MAKDMGKVYADMLTKELVRLRASHLAKMYELAPSNKRADKKRFEIEKDLVRQIDGELAVRVSQMGIFA